MAAHKGRLEGKVAIVTRGGYGFGAGIVDKFVEEGARVLIVDHNVDAGKDVLQGQPKGSAAFCHADVSKEKDWKRVIEAAVTAFGKLDIIVNNAGAVHKMQVSPKHPSTLLQPWRQAL